MRSKLNFLINYSLNKKIKTKWFLIANLIISILIIGIINVDSIITLFGGDFDSKIKIYIKDETEILYDGLKSNLEYYEENLYGTDSNKYELISTQESIEKLEKLIETQEKDSLVINIYFDEDNELEAELISLTTIDAYDYQLISSSISTTASIYTLNSIGLTEDQINKITSGINIERKIIDDEITSEDEGMEMIMTTVFPVIILPFFMLTIFLIQFIGTEVNDEKSTKSMEIIISNVSPTTHFASKIIANNLFIFLQFILLIIYGVIGFGIRKIIGGDSIINGFGEEIGSIFNTLTTGVLKDKLIIIAIFTILLMVLTFIAYSLLAGILASMTTNNEDFQQVQVPMVIILLLGYYLAIMAGMFKGATFIKILSFIPFISAILSPSLLVLGQIGVVEIVISVIIMLVTVYLLIKYGLRIYKVGILNYSSTGIWSKIFKSLRNK